MSELRECGKEEDNVSDFPGASESFSQVVQRSLAAVTLANPTSVAGAFTSAPTSGQGPVTKAQLTYCTKA